MGGTINFINKEQADTLLSLGFMYTEQKINSEQVVYSFIDTPKLREIINSKYDKTDFYINKTVNF